MSSQPIRIGEETLRTLRERSRRGGEPLARLAERYIEKACALTGTPASCSATVRPADARW
jgi:hypothetical protein